MDNNNNNFVKELHGDYIYKREDGFEYKHKGIWVLITSDELKEELIDYGNKVVEYYLENKEKVLNHLFKVLEQCGNYAEYGSKEEIIEKLGEPTIYVYKEVDNGQLLYLDSKLDEHLMGIELYGLELSCVIMDG